MILCLFVCGFCLCSQNYLVMGNEDSNKVYWYYVYGCFCFVCVAKVIWWWVMRIVTKFIDTMFLVVVCVAKINWWWVMRIVTKWIGTILGTLRVLPISWWCVVCAVYMYIYICVGDSFKVNWNYVGFLWVTPISW